MQISQDKFVSIVYKVTDQNGRELGSSEEGKPLTYIHGVIPILPGQEAELEGRSMGDQFTAHINPVGMNPIGVQGTESVSALLLPKAPSKV